MIQCRRVWGILFGIMWRIGEKYREQGIFYNSFIVELTNIIFINLKNEEMASSHEILCINKNDRFNPQERITHVGGKNSPTEKWKLTVDEAIHGIETGKWNFYVNKGGSRVKVIISTSKNGRKYLKTENDGEEPNNLLSLPECI